MTDLLMRKKTTAIKSMTVINRPMVFFVLKSQDFHNRMVNDLRIEEPSEQLPERQDLTLKMNFMQKVDFSESHALSCLSGSRSVLSGFPGSLTLGYENGTPLVFTGKLL